MKYQLILASQSPRRRELFSHLDLPFEVRVIEDIAEDFPADLTPEQTAVFIAEKLARQEYHQQRNRLQTENGKDRHDGKPTARNR